MIKQIDWACDENVLICFDREPVVMARVITPNMSSFERQSVKRFPFVCKKPLNVMVCTHKPFKQYNFKIFENYCFDGASIPRFFWRVIGSNASSEFLVAALVHDVICENHQYVDNDRGLSSKIFRALLIASGVNEIKANIMYEAVDLYQKLRGKWKNV